MKFEEILRPILKASSFLRPVALPFGCLLLLYVVLANSWVGEDSYITLRTVDNFLNGNGLRWNLHERVQAYTHPLWMFLISGFGFFHIPLYYSTLIASWICVFGAIWFLIKEQANLRIEEFDQKVSSAFLLLFLVGSRAFIDYSTSGLENPLSYLLLALLVREGNRTVSDASPIQLMRFFFVISMAYLNRQDTVLFAVPYFLYILYKNANRQFLPRLLWTGFLGGLPIFLWTAFSLLYYGYPVPNTAYAKLNTDISSLDLLFQGLQYLKNTLLWDPVTAIGIVLPLGLHFWEKRKFDPQFTLPFIGAISYVIYTAKIGGDFMSGRFLAAPFFVSVLILSRYQYKQFPYIVGLLFLIFGLFNPRSNLYTTPDYRRHRYDGHIVDEKGSYIQNSNFFRSLSVKEFPDHGWAEIGRKYKKDISLATSKSNTCITLNVGYFGFFSGSDKRIIDIYALTDPLLSKLPTSKPWRIGHFGRNIPEGYFESVKSGENKIQDPDLKEYYEKLKKITESEDLLAKDRLLAIWRENLGENRKLVDSYAGKLDPNWKIVPKGTGCGLGPGF
ncbi:hypothetical protein CH373_09980 [Leptospira perolatii]|uniref:Uncharacterized protein n=1 Tax=Leptospira perolatii TaxID=2023191 RepID=A0A2M9ZMR1_9LEPT|nr:hypothetical protein [Leptospira perolatii]PJZ70105.1 hypothetical protein CH360_07725 [Leptospira perolatii]PJZ73294.1 hypothetical protein CH373_09980 [Leptospira perolatii]